MDGQEEQGARDRDRAIAKAAYLVFLLSLLIMYGLYLYASATHPPKIEILNLGPPIREAAPEDNGGG